MEQIEEEEEEMEETLSEPIKTIDNKTIATPKVNETEMVILSLSGYQCSVESHVMLRYCMMLYQ